MKPVHGDGNFMKLDGHKDSRSLLPNLRDHRMSNSNGIQIDDGSEIRMIHHGHSKPDKLLVSFLNIFNRTFHSDRSIFPHCFDVVYNFVVHMHA